MTKKTEKITAFKLEFLEVEEGEKTPETALYVLDRSFKVIGKKKIDGGGSFRIPEKEIGAGHLIALGPNVEKPEELDKKLFTVYRGTQFKELVENKGMLPLQKKKWMQWMFVELTVSGSVKHCYPWPVLYQYFQKEMLSVQNISVAKALPEYIADMVSKKTLDWQQATPYPTLLNKSCNFSSPNISVSGRLISLTDPLFQASVTPSVYINMVSPFSI